MLRAFRPSETIAYEKARGWRIRLAGFQVQNSRHRRHLFSSSLDYLMLSSSAFIPLAPIDGVGLVGSVVGVKRATPASSRVATPPIHTPADARMSGCERDGDGKWGNFGVLPDDFDADTNTNHTDDLGCLWELS